jgi:trehalose/maltose hydrolase-like predicted phosphorylase
MGPDEYHESYPDREVGGLRNNSYTNILVGWAFQKIFEILNILDRRTREALIKRFHFSHDELEHWRDIRSRIQIPITDEGLLEQFEGYFDLKELNWEAYREKYGNSHRLDRILKAEGLSPDEYKVSKQADALMGFFVLERDGVVDILQNAEYRHNVENLLEENFEYYLRRTSHGSTLSNLTHAYLASVVENEALTWKFYQDALMSDYKDLQMGTTQEGIHVGVVAGSTVLTLRAFAGLRLDKEHLYISPNLPRTWRRLIFNLQFKGDRYEFELSPSKVEVRATSENKDSLSFLLRDQKVVLGNGQWETIELP